MLKTTKEFDFVYKNSYKFRAETLDICVLKPNLVAQFCVKFGRIPSDFGDFVGFSVSKKVGIAVERNLIKRRLRAICREFFNNSNSSLTRPSRELEKFSFDRLTALSQSNFSAQPTNLTQDTRIANDLKNESTLRGESTDSPKQSKKNRTNLICIFIAKNGILQMPFGALKESIFATLKRQINFRSDSHKNKRDFTNRANLKSTNHANRAHTKALQQ